MPSTQDGSPRASEQDQHRQPPGLAEIHHRQAQHGRDAGAPEDERRCLAGQRNQAEEAGRLYDKMAVRQLIELPEAEGPNSSLRARNMK